MAQLLDCPCGSGKPPSAQVDGYGIFLCYTCDKCYKEWMDYRSDYHGTIPGCGPIGRIKWTMVQVNQTYGGVLPHLTVKDTLTLFGWLMPVYGRIWIGGS